MKIEFTEKAYKKIRYFIDLVDIEISGLGKLKVENSSFIIYDIELFPQSSGMAHTNLDIEALGQFVYKKTQEGESLEDYKVWWHSHGSMDSYFSAKDVQTINNTTEFDYMVSIVGNKKGKIIGRLDMYEPERITLSNLPVSVKFEEDKELKELCQKEINNNYKRK